MSEQHNDRLDRIELIVESNSRAIQAMLEQRATDRFEHEQRMRRMEATIASQNEINQKLLKLQEGLARMIEKIDDDRPTILRKLNTIGNKTDCIDLKLDRSNDRILIYFIFFT